MGLHGAFACPLCANSMVWFVWYGSSGDVVARQWSKARSSSKSKGAGTSKSGRAKSAGGGGAKKATNKAKRKNKDDKPTLKATIKAFFVSLVNPRWVVPTLYPTLLSSQPLPLPKPSLRVTLTSVCCRTRVSLPVSPERWQCCSACVCASYLFSSPPVATRDSRSHQKPPRSFTD